jgi:alpha-beta hydrolase superfamily lysophospholipase
MLDKPAADRPVRAALRLAALKLVLAAQLCAAISSCVIVDWEQRRWIFQPIQDAWGPGVAAAEGMHDVWIDFVSAHPEQRGEAVRLHGLWVPQPDTEAPVLLFLHGVRWDVRASATRMRQLHALGFSVLGIDYRGFGRSTPFMPSETLVAEDARAAWAWLARTHPHVPRYVFGHSLGAAIAVRLAHEVPDESGQIVEGAFTSTADVLRSTSWSWLPVFWLITQRFDAASRIAQVGSPVLVVHGSEDTMVAPKLGRALYDQALPPKRFLLVEGAVHENTDVIGHEMYRTALRELFGLGKEVSQPAITSHAASTRSEPTRE